MPAIVRIDAGGTHGYQARIGGSVGYESKLFSDRKCGGKRKAKAAAIAWLEERGDRWAPRQYGPKKTIQINNMSGTPGVHQSRLVRDGATSEYWAAHYSVGPNGKRTHRSKRFYYGTKRTSDEAKALAVEFRTRWVDAYEKGGADAIKEFFKAWDTEHPSTRKKPAKRSRASASKGKRTAPAKAKKASSRSKSASRA